MVRKIRDAAYSPLLTAKQGMTSILPLPYSVCLTTKVRKKQTDSHSVSTLDIFSVLGSSHSSSPGDCMLTLRD